VAELLRGVEGDAIVGEVWPCSKVAIVSNEGNLAGGFRGSLVKRPSRLGTVPLKYFVPIERHETMNLITYRSEELPGASGMNHRPGSFK
jgi:hypothetical protein